MIRYPSYGEKKKGKAPRQKEGFMANIRYFCLRGIKLSLTEDQLAILKTDFGLKLTTRRGESFYMKAYAVEFANVKIDYADFKFIKDGDNYKLQFCYMVDGNSRWLWEALVKFFVKNKGSCRGYIIWKDCVIEKVEIIDGENKTCEVDLMKLLFG